MIILSLSPILVSVLNVLLKGVAKVTVSSQVFAQLVNIVSLTSLADADSPYLEFNK